MTYRGIATTYTSDPDFITPGLPRIQSLRRKRLQTTLSPRERGELTRLEASQRRIEFDWHRSQKRAAYQRRHDGAHKPPA